MSRSIALLLLTLLAAAPARAQYFAFGKNKIQYQAHDWAFVQTEHFDVYYYGGGYPLAAFASQAAEEAYGQIRTLLGHDLSRRVPILLYAGHRAFAATTAVDLPDDAQGIGGVTELFKNRVVLPFTGDYAEFRHVLHHELVHAVLNDQLYGGSIQAILQNNLRARLPIWMGEGLAEYAAEQWSTRADAYLRDAVIGGTLPDVHQLNGFSAYWGGQAFFDYVAEEYGVDKIAEVLGYLRTTRDLDAALSQAVGLDLDGLSERWHRTVQAAHFPEAVARVSLAQTAQPLVLPEAGSVFSSSPALSPLGDRLAYVSSEGGTFGVYVVETRRGAQPRRIVAGQASAQFEALRLLSPGLSWSPDGTRLAVAVTSGRHEAVAVVNVATGGAAIHPLPGAEQVAALAWHPSREVIAVQASDAAQSDLFLLHLPVGVDGEGRVVRLTDDLLTEHAPAWAPGGDALFFHADSTAGSLESDRRGADIYRLPIDVEAAGPALTRSQALLRDTLSGVSNPQVVRTRDGRLEVVFVSDATGIANLYALDPATGRSRLLTNLLEGAMQISVTPDGARTAVMALSQGSPTLFLLRDVLADSAAAAPTVWAMRRAPTAGEAPALRIADASIRENNAFLRDATRALAPTPIGDAQPPDSADGSLGRIRIDFGDPESQDDDTLSIPSRSPTALGYADSLGRPIPHPYRLTFSTDIVYASSEVNTLYGLQGTAQIRFSDLTGAYRLYGGSNLLLDLRNSDYVVGFESIGARMDWDVQGAHVSRVLETDTLGRSLARYRLYSASAGLVRPLDRFRRVEGRLALLGVSEANLFDPSEPTVSRLLLYPSLTYTHDATEYGAWGVRSGRRGALSLAGAPVTVSGESARFVTLLGDARAYATRGRYTLAVRASGAASVGTDPQAFYTSGVQGWLNPRANSGGPLPTTGLSGFAFATPILPLRGYAINARQGPYFGLVNVELRVPLVQSLSLRPLPTLYGLRAIAFADAGAVWGGPNNPAFNALAVQPEGRRLDDVLVGMGAGLRSYVFGLPLGVDVAYPFDGVRLGEPKVYFALSADF